MLCHPGPDPTPSSLSPISLRPMEEWLNLMGCRVVGWSPQKVVNSGNPGPQNGCDHSGLMGWKLVGSYDSCIGWDQVGSDSCN